MLNPSPYGPLAVPRIEAIAYEDKASCVQYGRVQNIIEAGKAASFVLQKLENNPALLGGHADSAFVGLAGRSLGSISTSAEIKLPTEMEIDEDIVQKLHTEATKALPGDKMVLKVVPKKYYVDNQICQNVVGALGSVLRGEFTIVTCNAANKSNLERVMKDRLGLPVQQYVVTPLTLADMVLGDEEKQLGCVLVDLGSQTTSVSVYKDRALQYLATLPLGSNNITLDLASGLNLTYERAEMAKCTQGNATFEQAAAQTEDEAKIACYVQARLGEIWANVMAQIGFAGYKPADLSKGIVLTGRGAKLTNMVQFVETNCKMKVRTASVPHTVALIGHDLVANDFTSLISIIDFAASRHDLKSCMTFPPAPEQAPDTANQTFDFAPSEQGAHSVSDDEPDDESWAYDDEEVERRNALRERMRQKDDDRRARELQKQEARKAKEEEKRNKPPRKSWIDMIKKKMNDIVTYDPSNDDEDLDEASGLK